ncbi:glutamate racemase [Haloactinospora alba]|uniref:Glutamate racemase n=1 Tax=Haloactinospora alba TaxID=405555 RepID=A0A543NKJ9_9ACTN|nr:aspartate/glutamate racemase family protein [Haloactinospora alba]TQN32329.1 glutamate racemase [Haloactinospora alba]
MRIALVDSGLGMLSTAAALRAARPDADLVLSMDPDHMPWGPRSPEDVIGRALAGARAAMDPPPAAGSDGSPAPRPDAVVVPCNTASVHGLSALRAEFEPDIPVVGTVPPIKPAAEAGSPIAVWATAATTHSRYQNSLIASFAPDTAVAQVACVGLAEAVESADRRAVAGAVRRAAERTPGDTTSVVLGCTHYDLVSASISAALGPDVPLFTAADAVAAQTLRRIGTFPDRDASPTGSTVVLASGRRAGLPTAALRYSAGASLLRSGGAVSS